MQHTVTVSLSRQDHHPATPHRRQDHHLSGCHCSISQTRSGRGNRARGTDPSTAPPCGARGAGGWRPGAVAQRQGSGVRRSDVRSPPRRSSARRPCLLGRLGAACLPRPGSGRLGLGGCAGGAGTWEVGRTEERGAWRPGGWRPGASTWPVAAGAGIRARVAGWVGAAGIGFAVWRILGRALMEPREGGRRLCCG